MRNYVQFFWAKITYQVDVNPPNPPVDEKTFGMDQSQVALDSLVAQIIESLTSDPRVMNVHVDNRGPVYWLLDKTNLTLILQGPGFSAMQLFDQTGFWPSYIFQGDVSGGDTPRDGWTDDNGVKREPPPSEEAAAAKHGGGTAGGGKLPTSQLDFLHLLGQIYLSLVNLGNATAMADANIVLNIMNAFQNRRITQTQAIKRLIPVQKDFPSLFGLI